MEQNLRDVLRDWTPIDVAGYQLAAALGLMPAGIFPTRAKHVFWTNHPISAALLQMLDQLVVLGVLEHRTEPDFEYRWNAAFRGSWEGSP